MIPLPFTPATPGEHMLANYLQAEPGRLPVLQNIMNRLDEDGSVGDRARYYVVRSSFRRAVLRGTLIALAFNMPSWAKESVEAADTNRHFAAGYRDKYNSLRRDERNAASPTVNLQTF